MTLTAVFFNAFVAPLVLLAARLRLDVLDRVLDPPDFDDAVLRFPFRISFLR
jgi:hypothetical protein